MSRTYDILCIDCKVHYWCGQASQDNGRMYDQVKTWAFLYEHMGHQLRFDLSEFMPDGMSKWGGEDT